MAPIFVRFVRVPSGRQIVAAPHVVAPERQSSSGFVSKNYYQGTIFLCEEHSKMEV